jgi:uncharacterized protein YkwD
MHRLLSVPLAIAIAATISIGASASAVAAGPCDNADIPVDQLTQDAAEGAVLCLTNEERIASGLSELTLNAELTSSARGHAEAAVTLKWWAPGADSHTNPETGSTPADRTVAAGFCQATPGAWSVYENTFWGYSWGDGAVAPTPRAAVAWWMSSPGHQENILRPDMTELGVGIVLDTAEPVVEAPVAAGTFVQNFGTCA